MDFEEYKNCVWTFLEDTKNWEKLSVGKFYTTADFYGWVETLENEHDGLDLSWAFQQTVTDQKIANMLVLLLAQEFVSETNLDNPTNNTNRD